MDGTGMGSLDKMGIMSRRVLTYKPLMDVVRNLKPEISEDCGTVEAVGILKDCVDDLLKQKADLLKQKAQTQRAKLEVQSQLEKELSWSAWAPTFERAAKHSVKDIPTEEEWKGMDLQAKAAACRSTLDKYSMVLKNINMEEVEKQAWSYLEGLDDWWMGVFDEYFKSMRDKNPCKNPKCLSKILENTYHNPDTSETPSPTRLAFEHHMAKRQPMTTQGDEVAKRNECGVHFVSNEEDNVSTCKRLKADA